MGVQELLSEFYTIQEVAKILNRHQAYVYRLINSGQLAYYNIASRRYVHKDDLEAYIRGAKVIVQKEPAGRTKPTSVPQRGEAIASYPYKIKDGQILPG